MSAKEVEFEVLPPLKSPERDPARLLAWLLDDFIRIPGTNFRFGLDPIITLIPGIGDGSATVVASLILLQAFRRRVPRIVLVRMAVNILLNALIGIVPGIGDVVSAWFKSNRKNYQLLVRHAGTARTSTTSDWLFIGCMLGVILAGGLLIALAAAYLAYHTLALLFGHS